MLDEYTETKEFVEEEKPYWLFLDAKEELTWGLFNYFPEAHYKKAVDEAFQEEAEKDLIPDGGRYNETVFAWYDPDTDSLLYHTEVNEEFADPFFDSEADARSFLEKRAETGDNDQYENLSLKKLRGKKVGDAVEVLTDQSGLEEFVPDGGFQPVYFWYDPHTDSITTEAFDDKQEAIRSLADESDGYGLDDIKHLELYEAEKLGDADRFIR